LSRNAAVSKRLVVEHALLLRLGDQLADDPVEGVVQPLAAAAADDVPLGVDHDERRPRPAVVGLPDLLVAVVHDRVLDLVPEHRLADRLRVLLGLELGRVDADHDQLVGPLFFEPGQVGHDVDAVDAAVSPEVEEDDLPLEVLERERLAGIEPRQPGLELGGLVAVLRQVVFRLLRLLGGRGLGLLFRRALGGFFIGPGLVRAGAAAGDGQADDDGEADADAQQGG
jgi:hypothetical protein